MKIAGNEKIDLLAYIRKTAQVNSRLCICGLFEKRKYWIIIYPLPVS
jgi:hypothetical protein